MRPIDADALSEKLCKTTIFVKDGEVFQRMINDAPTVSAEARPTGEWIPVSERLPENTEQVLITVLWHKPYDNYEVTLGEYWHDSEGWGDWKDAEIVAWKPLPEPYKKDGEEE